MYIPITGFGNVTLGDSVKLAKALRTEAASWRRPEVAFTGGAALEFKGDESVWAKLDGDIDDLKTIGRGVPHVVQRLGFFVDRRQFRPWLSVGTITDDTTAPYLESVVAALDGFRGRSWTVEAVSLMKRPRRHHRPGGLRGDGADAARRLLSGPLSTAARSSAVTGPGSPVRGRPADLARFVGEHLEQLVERHRPVHQVALGVRRVHVLAQVLELAGPLDALDDHVEAQRLAHHRDRAEQRAGALVAVDALRERQVGLDDLHRHVLQVADRGEADPEVVDGERHATAGQRLHRLQRRPGRCRCRRAR